MVSSILTLLCLGRSITTANDINEQQARTIADTFRVFAASAGGQTIIGPVPSTNAGILRADAPTGVWDFRFPDGIINISAATGRVSSFTLDADTGFSATWDSEHALSPSQLASFANLYYNQAGFSGTLTIAGFQADNYLGGPPNIWHAEAIRYMQGIELHPNYNVAISVEHVSGRLVSMFLKEPPFPCANTTANVSSMTALLNFTQYIHNKTGESGFIVRNPMHPVIWVANGEDLTTGFNELTPAYDLYKQNNQGYLIYWCLLESTQSSMGKGLPRWYFGHVDSHTGAVLGASVPSAFGASPDKPKPPVGWNFGSGEFEIVCGNKAVKVLRADVYATPTPRGAPAQGKQIVLKRGKLLLICQFDSKSGLLWKSEGKNRQFGKPNAGLLICLRKVVAK